MFKSSVKKASKRLYALSGVFNHFEKNKMRLLMKSLIKSTFSYCPLIWMFHNRNMENRIQERVLRLVLGGSQKFFWRITCKE